MGVLCLPRRGSLAVVLTLGWGALLLVPAGVGGLSSFASANAVPQNLAPGVAPSDAWAQFGHDPQHTGRSALEGPAGTPVALWNASVGYGGITGFGAPVQGQDHTIWVAGQQLKGDDQNGTGVAKFSPTHLGPRHAHETFAGSPGIAASGLIVAGETNGILQAFDLSGVGGWTTHTAGGVAPPITSSVTISPSGVTYAGAGSGKLFAFSPNGSRIWQVVLAGAIHSTPAVDPNGTVYVGSSDDNLYAIAPNGTELWKYNTSNSVVSSPAIAANGVVYVGSEDGSLYAVYPNGSLDWSLSTGGPVLSSPAIATDGTVYFGSDDGLLYAVWPNGTLRWTFGPFGGTFEGSLAIDANGTIYATTSNGGVLYAIGPGGALAWKMKFGSGLSSPIVGFDRVVYVLHTSGSGYSSQGRLFAIGTHDLIRVSFTESGLPASTAWNVTVGSKFNSSRGTLIGFIFFSTKAQPTWRISETGCGTGCRYEPFPASGSVALSRTSHSYHITFIQQYQVHIVTVQGGFKSSAGSQWCDAGASTRFNAPDKSPYAFVNWTSLSSQITIVRPNSASTPVYVNATGVIQAYYI